MRVGSCRNVLVHKGPHIAVLFQKGPAFNSDSDGNSEKSLPDLYKNS